MNKVYAVHYLLAGPGQELASAFGHSMIRIVMCAPDRTTVGPECMMDTEHHLVLSFRGFVDTPKSSALSGLFGDYPSRLFFLPLSQVIEEYTSTEFRDLNSYPLNLTHDEMKLLLQKASEVHWSHKSKYYFLSNNCATETMNLIKAGTQNSRLREAVKQTPQSVLETLQLAKMTQDSSFFNNKDAAEKNGFFFPSKSQSLENMWQNK